LFSRKVKYLDHIISEKEIAIDPEKTWAIESWPKNKKQVRSFFGFCSYYRRLVKGFWIDSCQEAFVTLKQTLISSPVLSFPTEGEFILDTNTSNHGLGAVLPKKTRVSRKSYRLFHSSIK